MSSGSIPVAPVTPVHRVGDRFAWVARAPLVAYFLLAFLGTWIIVVPLALAGGEYGLGILPFTVPEGVDFLLVQLSAYTGPLLAAMTVSTVLAGREGRRVLWRRVRQWRVGWIWYVIALLAPLTIWLVAYSIPLKGQPVRDLGGEWSLLFSHFLPFVLIGLLLPSLGEEPGWRGFALPRLQTRYGPLGGTLVLGAMHALWHVPAFYTAALGPVSVPALITFVIAAIGATFIYTVVANRTGGSILLAILLHAASNAASGLLNQLVPEVLPLDGWLYTYVDDGWLNATAFALVALALVVATRGRLGWSHPDQVR